MQIVALFLLAPVFRDISVIGMPGRHLPELFLPSDYQNVVAAAVCQADSCLIGIDDV